MAATPAVTAPNGQMVQVPLAAAAVPQATTTVPGMASYSMIHSNVNPGGAVPAATPAMSQLSTPSSLSAQLPTLTPIPSALPTAAPISTTAGLPPLSAYTPPTLSSTLSPGKSSPI